MSLWRKFSRQWVFDACAFTKNQVERKTLAHNPSQTTKKLSMGCSLICGFLTALDSSRQKRWFGSSRCKQIDFYFSSDREEFRDKRWEGRTMINSCNSAGASALSRGRCAPPRLKYFWWWRKRISSELSCLISSELSCLISHLGEIKEWCCLYRREQDRV